MSGVQQVEAAARGDDGAVLGADAGGQGVRVVGVGRRRRGGRRVGGGTAAAPPAATNAVAALTAPSTASPTRAPSASSPAAVAANRSPAPQESPWWEAGAGTSNGCSPYDSRAPREPRVTATAATLQSRTRAAALCAAARRPPPVAPSGGAKPWASFSAGVTSRVPGTGGPPRGCGSQTSGGRAASSSRSASAVPRP